MYNANEKKEFQKKDRRISWLSIFSSLNTNHSIPNSSSPQELAKIAYELNDELNEKYPMEEPQPFPTTNENRGNWSDPINAKECPVCKSSMEFQADKSNPKGPDWKCSNKECKYQWDKASHTWIKSKYITGIWNK